MAWTAPRTWTTAEIVTATIMNTHVRDNLDYLNDTKKAKEVWSTAAFYYDGANNQPLGSNGAPLQGVNHQGGARMRVPEDYTSITEAVLVVRPTATQANADYDLALDKMPIGGTLTSQTDGATTYNVTNGQTFEIPFTTLWTTLAPVATDIVQFRLVEGTGGHDVQILGAFIRYA